jgi:hypothetical protein
VNLRTQLGRLVGRVGLVLRPNLFVKLQAPTLKESEAAESAEIPTISGGDSHGFVGISHLIPPQGLEPWTR